MLAFRNLIMGGLLAITFTIILASFQGCSGCNQKECIVPDIKWLTIEQLSNNTSNFDFSNQLRIAAKKDLDGLNIKANINSFPNVKKVFSNVEDKQVQVSQSFYEAYKAKRASICGMLKTLESGNIKNDGTRFNIEKQILTSLIELGSLNGGNPSVPPVVKEANKLLSDIDTLSSLINSKISSLSEMDKIEANGQNTILNDLKNFILFDIERLNKNDLNEIDFKSNLDKNMSRYQESARIINAL